MKDMMKIDWMKYEDRYEFEWKCNCGAIFEMQVWDVGDNYTLPKDDGISCESCGAVIATWPTNSPKYLMKHMTYAGPG